MQPKTAENPDTNGSLYVNTGDSAHTEPDLTFIGDPGDCDVCGRPLDDELLFCDAKLPAHVGRWGLLCTVCSVNEGISSGWGNAQFYERQKCQTLQETVNAELRWRCVAGKPPINESDT